MEGVLALLSSKQHWHNHVRKHLFVCVNSQKLQLSKLGVGHDNSFPLCELPLMLWILELNMIEQVYPLVLVWLWWG